MQTLFISRKTGFILNKIDSKFRAKKVISCKNMLFRGKPTQNL